MIAAAVVAQAAVIGRLRAGLAAILFSLGNRAGAFRVRTFVLDCFGHRISPVRHLFVPFFDAQALREVTKRGLIS
jgi:hypothetical protein